MFDLGDISRLAHPLKKGIWFVLACIILTVWIVNKLVKYQNPQYESELRLRLDNKEHGFGQFNLYKDFDVFINSHQILTEVEILKSEVILQKTLDKLDFDVTYFRIGDLRTAEIYKESPFRVKYTAGLEESTFGVKILDLNKFELTYREKIIPGRFDEQVFIGDDTLTLNLVDKIVKKTEHHGLEDVYKFRINSKAFLISHVVRPNLFVKEIDKDIPIIRIIFQSEVPEKASLFANTLAQSYLEDYLDNKSKAASLTGEFLEDRINEIGEKLKESETALEKFRLENKVINTKQETETGFRKLAQLEVQNVNIEMKLAALDSLEKYVSTNVNKFIQLAPSFEEHGGLLFTEMIKKLKALQDQKREMLLNYKPESTEIRIIDEKMDDVILYVVESIKKHKERIQAEKSRIVSSIEEAEHQFDDLPTLEKQMVRLERIFTQNQELYNYLSKKRAEAMIAKVADISFHRIIQAAETPDKPFSPKKAFLIVAGGFMAMLLSVFLVYTLYFFQGKINHRDQLTKWGEIPVLGVTRLQDNPEMRRLDLENLLTSLTIQHNFDEKLVLTISSYHDNEGKSYLADNLAILLKEKGKNVVMIDSGQKGIFKYLSKKLSTRNNQHGELEEAGFSTNYFERLPKSIKEEADIIIIDTESLSKSADGLTAIRKSSINLIMVRYNRTKLYSLRHLETLRKQFDLKNLFFVFNGVPSGYNYIGRREQMPFMSPVKVIWGWIGMLKKVFNFRKTTEN